MAKKKRKKGKAKRKAGKMRGVPRMVAICVAGAIAKVRRAKMLMEKKAPKARKAWAELHNVESRLTRLV